MFGAALLDCLNLNNIPNIEHIKRELVTTGKTSLFEIKSERKILELERDSSFASFRYRKSKYYLIKNVKVLEKLITDESINNRKNNKKNLYYSQKVINLQ